MPDLAEIIAAIAADLVAVEDGSAAWAAITPRLVEAGVEPAGMSRARSAVWDARRAARKARAKEARAARAAGRDSL